MPRRKMSAGVRWSGAASDNRIEERQLHGWEEMLDAFSEELRRRPESRINNSVASMVYLQFGLKGIGGLTLLWATVVLLGGFVSQLKPGDFRNVTIIAFMQAAGLFDTMVLGDARLMVFMEWVAIHRMSSTLQGRFKSTMLLIKRIIMFFALMGPVITCILLSCFIGPRIDDYGADRDASKANLIPALNLFYNATLVHGVIYISFMVTGLYFGKFEVWLVSQQNGFSPEVVRAYLQKTTEMCLSNPASITNWNLITYGAGLLDSQLPGDYAAGGRVLTMLIGQHTPAPVVWLLIRSPRQRIQKLIGTLAWRSPAEREMRWLAASIVGHLAGYLNLAHFPGALECISSLFDTSSQESFHLPFLVEHSGQRKRTLSFRLFVHILKIHNAIMTGNVGHVFQLLIGKKDGTLENGGILEGDSKQREYSEGIDADLVLPGLRILDNLTRDRHNCTLIYNTKDLLSKIVAPISSNECVQDIKSNDGWSKIVDGSLKVVSRLMGSPGSTGEEMRRLIAHDSTAVKNLEAVLDMDTKSNDDIMELQMRAIEVLTQLALHHAESTSAAKLIERALHIFLTTHWMEEYLKDEKRKMKEAKKTASLLKEKAGEALAMLSSDAEALKSFTGCADDVNRLTELLDSNIKTIKCKLSATDTVEVEINIGCRISATVILKHLSNYVQVPTLRKALEQLLLVQEDEPLTLQSHIKQCGERRLQAELLSLVATIRANNNLNLAGILLSQTPPDTLEDFVVRLKKMVQDNMYATPACLATQKLTCEMVTEFLQHDRNVKVIDKHNIVGTLMKASKTMAGLERNMLFAGIDRDCHGVPLKPLSSVLAKNAEDLLAQRKQVLGINIAPGTASAP